MRGPDWLAARPVAHRGLHDRARGIVENMPAAFVAAVEGNYSIELDLQLTADGEAMVHHDDRLGRVAEGDAALRDMTAAQLRRVTFKDTAERMISLSDLLTMVAGRVPLPTHVNPDNLRYLLTKRDRMGHDLYLPGDTPTDAGSGEKPSDDGESAGLS